MPKEKYTAPPITWLRIPDYMYGSLRTWLTRNLGGAVRALGKPVLSVQYLPGAREILKMETRNDTMDFLAPAPSMSVTRMNCLDAGLHIDPDTMKRKYGTTPELLRLYVPIECPRMALTRNGVLRPWTKDTTFGREQASMLQRLLRDTFWHAVEVFDENYVHEGRHSDKAMIEEFCKETDTPDVHVDALRREWQRRRRKSVPSNR